MPLSSTLLYGYHRAEAVRSARLGRARYGAIGPWLILALVNEVAEIAICSILTANLRVHEEAWLAIAQLVLRGTH